MGRKCCPAYTLMLCSTRLVRFHRVPWTKAIWGSKFNKSVRSLRHSGQSEGVGQTILGWDGSSVASPRKYKFTVGTPSRGTLEKQTKMQLWRFAPSRGGCFLPLAKLQSVAFFAHCRAWSIITVFQVTSDLWLTKEKSLWHFTYQKKKAKEQEILIDQKIYSMCWFISYSDTPPSVIFLCVIFPLIINLIYWGIGSKDLCHKRGTNYQVLPQLFLTRPSFSCVISVKKRSTGTRKHLVLLPLNLTLAMLCICHSHKMLSRGVLGKNPPKVSTLSRKFSAQCLHEKK